MLRRTKRATQPRNQSAAPTGIRPLGSKARGTTVPRKTSRSPTRARSARVSQASSGRVSAARSSHCRGTRIRRQGSRIPKLIGSSPAHSTSESRWLLRPPLVGISGTRHPACWHAVLARQGLARTRITLSGRSSPAIPKKAFLRMCLKKLSRDRVQSREVGETLECSKRILRFEVFDAF
jgi:hypothetical protein